MAKWRKIKSAPKDGEQVLLTGYIDNDPEKGRWLFAAYWCCFEGRWIENADCELHPPTHWKALPKPPQSLK